TGCTSPRPSAPWRGFAPDRLGAAPAFPPGRDSGAAHRQQLAGRLVELVDTIRRTHHDVLDAHAVAPLQIDAGLDAERVAGLERGVVALDDVRVLVHLDADAMTQPVEERLGIATLVDDGPRRAVDVLWRDTGPDRGTTRGVRLPH